MSNSFLSLLSFQCFKADIIDPAYTMACRVSEPMLGLTIGAMKTLGFKIRRKGKIWGIEHPINLAGSQVTAAFLDQCRESVNSNIVAISLTPPNVLCEMESGRLPDESTIRSTMLTNPKAILKSRYESDRRYQVVPSLDRKKYLGFSVNNREIGMLERIIKDSGLEIARMQIGIANLAEAAIRRVETARKDGTKKFVLVGDHTLLLYLCIKDGTWEETFNFMSRNLTGGAMDASSIVQFLDSMAAELDESGSECYMLASQTAWWQNIAEEWFAQQASRVNLIKVELSSPHPEMITLMEN